MHAAPSPRERARALADPTRFRIHELVRSASEPMTVADLAAATEVHHTAVRRHLARLVAAGLVTERPRRSGTRGRPTFEYAPGVPEPAFGDTDPYAWLSLRLLEMRRSRRSPRAAGRSAGADAVRAEAATATEPTRVLETQMGRLGFAPMAAAGAHGCTDIVLGRCPFADAAATDPATVCTLHRGLAEGILAALEAPEVVHDLEAHDPTVAGCVLRVGPRPAPRGRAEGGAA